MTKLLAFHNDPKIKERYLARVRGHIAADELIHGQYWENGKGCAVGCTIHSGSHESYETELGVPRLLAMIEDGIFDAAADDAAAAAAWRAAAAARQQAREAQADKLLELLAAAPVKSAEPTRG